MKKLVKPIIAAMIAIAIIATISPTQAQAAAKKPAKVTVTSVKSNDVGKSTVKYKKVANAKGYQIQLATNSKFSSDKKTVKVGNVKTVSKTVSGLKQGKKYYVRVRAYKTSGKKIVYGSWSKAKTVTVKIATPKKATITSITTKTVSGKNNITVNYKKLANTTGYQVQYAKDSKFKTSPKTVAVDKASTVKKTISGLSANTKYYVRVRGVNKINGSVKYGAWSNAKAITTPKAANKAAHTHNWKAQYKTVVDNQGHTEKQIVDYDYRYETHRIQFGYPYIDMTQDAFNKGLQITLPAPIPFEMMAESVPDNPDPAGTVSEWSVWGQKYGQLFWDSEPVYDVNNEYMELAKKNLAFYKEHGFNGASMGWYDPSSNNYFDERDGKYNQIKGTSAFICRLTFKEPVYGDVTVGKVTHEELTGYKCSCGATKGK